MRGWLVLGSVLALAGCAPAEDGGLWTVPEVARARENPLRATAESLQEGERLYQRECLICHGVNGDGSGPWSERLSKAPGELTDRQRMARMTDGEIFWKIGAGRDPMPPFGDRLSEEERWHLVNYLRTFTGGAK